jgi:uncharacterized glyoxalase superfamily protein PhnB
MIANRSVPVDTVLPHLVYEDVEAAAAWLCAHFGFVETFRYGEPAQGVQMRLGRACIMLSGMRDQGGAGASQAGGRIQMLTIFVEDLEAHHTRARAAGVEIVEPLHETVYGELQYGAEDHEGQRWLFARHVRDVAPAEWGARTPGG